MDAEKYICSEIFHILNRGVDKRIVFKDSQDHARFVQDMYLFNNQNKPPRNIYRNKMDVRHRMTHIVDGVTEVAVASRLVKIHAWCLMPNHYHLLLSPCVENGISLFMKKLNMGYSRYFNDKNKRTGALWQGRYKSIHINTDSHFLYIPHYIHANPLDMSYPEWRTRDVKNEKSMLDKLLEYKWSSLQDYIGIKNFPSILYKDDLQEILCTEASIKNTMGQLFTKENDSTQYLSQKLEY